jgi:hypothetical protein
MSKEKLTVFALEKGSGEYDVRYSFDQIKSFHDELGYAFTLNFASEMTNLANRLKDIKRVIDILEDWKSQDFFKFNKTTYKIDWHHSRYKSEVNEVTLPQARKLYKDTKLQHDTLLNVINETYIVHGEKQDGTYHDRNEFLNDIEI